MSPQPNTTVTTANVQFVLANNNVVLGHTSLEIIRIDP